MEKQLPSSAPELLFELDLCKHNKKQKFLRSRLMVPILFDEEAAWFSTSLGSFPRDLNVLQHCQSLGENVPRNRGLWAS